MYRNIPKGATLIEEQWDDSLPEPLQMATETHLQNEYNINQLPIYDPDSPAKLETIVKALGESDYVVLASQRLYATIPRLPARYPFSSRYYELLFDGRLGFDLVAFARRDISLGSLVIVDDTFPDAGLRMPPALAAHPAGAIVWDWGRADESFSVYDHPIPLVFKKTRPFSSAEYTALLMAPSDLGFDRAR
jgi:hypothetical protein